MKKILITGASGGIGSSIADKFLKNKYEMVLLDFNYLSSPKKLLEYQSKYFEEELSEIDIKNLKKITLKENKLKIEEFIDSTKNDKNF